MIAALLAAAPVLGALGRQELPAQGCAAYLWRVDDPARARGLAAVAGADPARLRLMLDGRVVDLAREAAAGDAGFGLALSATYRAGDVAATLTLPVVPHANLRDGGIVGGGAVGAATLRLARAGDDELIVAVAGLVGCRPDR